MYYIINDRQLLFYELRNMMKKINMDTIVQDPNPVLRQVCEPVAFPLEDKDRQIMQSLLDYVHNSRDEDIAEKENLQAAVGIAAPQIGIKKQMTAIVVDIEQKDGSYKVVEYALINPKIVSHSIKKVALVNGEGCLSVRKVHEGYVPRHKRVRLKAYDMIREEFIDIRLSNYLSVVIQHEIDHLNGILFYDHINKETPWFEDELEIID